ncbi:MAG TPA: alkaline phosphatase PhoX [Steroidobacteraceae bacterium]|nr:alkaline phosphatase PhoX [Steroidobacteraceae bacterium]
MHLTPRLLAISLICPLFATAAAVAADLTPVPNANPKSAGISAPNVLSPELAEIAVVQGSTPLENPAGQFSHYGYNNNSNATSGTPMVPALGSNVESTKTEPDKNTYLVFRELSGADPAYDYGHRFLFQGHENSSGGKSYITRVNLDADFAHRVTLLATTDTDNNPLPEFDGSTWYPWSERLLFSAEGANGGGVWQATPGFPSVVDSLVGIMGQGGYEGMQADSRGNVWIVEDSGGSSGTAFPHAKRPNSFIFRFVPKDPRDLKKGGKLQALQVLSKAHSGPIVFTPGTTAAMVDGDIGSQDQKDLHTYGNSFKTKWVTIHDTAVDGTSAFDANALAKVKLATPFKRPENAQFRPGTGFREFFFDTTGDTNALTEAGSFGGFGAVFKLTQNSPAADEGTLSLFYLSDLTHSGFDNVAFWSVNEIVFVQDMGDTMHTQIDAFDSAFLLDVRKDYSKSSNQPVRILALGRDPSSTIDAGLSGTADFQNEGDNEITGIHVSDGDPSVGGLLGAKLPWLFHFGWRAFYTQQHGDNTTFEIVPSPDHVGDGKDDHGHDDR